MKWWIHAPANIRKWMRINGFRISLEMVESNGWIKMIERNGWIKWLNQVIEWNDWMKWLNEMVESSDWMKWLNQVIESSWMKWLNQVIEWNGWIKWLSQVIEWNGWISHPSDWNKNRRALPHFPVFQIVWSCAHSTNTLKCFQQLLVEDISIRKVCSITYLQSRFKVMPPPPPN